jgi:D-aminopeptidase
VARLRDLGFTIGTAPTGSLNAITDVAGVCVGHATVVRDEPRIARTGVTIVTPRPRGEWTDLCYGGMHSFNGNGEMTGSHWLVESGLLSGPIGITNTHQVGLVRDALAAEEVRREPDATWCLPIVGETYDGFLNDIDAFHLTADDVRAALADAEHPGLPVAEGNVGGGTGMICHQFKGGIGTSSRRVATAGATYTVGVLVQANYGARELLRLDGRPVGREVGADVVPLPTDPAVADAGSIIVIVATDAPLLADQCRRLARRATVGLARVGGTGGNGSGDIFLAFSTGNRVPIGATTPTSVVTLPAGAMTPLFDATAEAVEESIWNALIAAETMTGHRGRVVHAIPHDLLVAASAR